jgi:energy-coupling factor transporter ATP-binding protein EcfA2
MPKWFLKAVEINGGFLPGLSLQFSPGLTCIIGPRGSGKSTLAEALRYGIGGIGRASDASLVQANLATALVTLTTAPQVGELGYTIRRAFRQPAALVTSEGKSIESLDLDRGTFLPLDAYNSREIEAIANETLGDKRRALLDDLREDDLREIILVLAEAQRALEANADSVGACRRVIRDITEQIEEIGDARARLSALPLPPGGVITSQLAQLTQALQASEGEIRNLDDLIGRLENWKVSAGKFGDEQKRRLFKPAIHEASANKEIISKTLEIIDALSAFSEKQSQQIVSQIDLAVVALRQQRVAIEKVKIQQADQTSRLQQENSVAGQAIRERSVAEQVVEKLLNLEKRRSDEQATLRELLDVRSVLKGDFLLKREKVSTLRETLANELQNKIGSHVRLRLIRNADNLAYREMLTQGLRGARVRNHDEILNGLMQMRPEQLAQVIQDNDLDEFESILSFGRERSSRILESFRASLNPLEMEVVEIEDRVSIELNVASEGNPHFKDAAELSQGQKCTALLPLLLSRREVPLLIDQPEDNLDNHFIYETIVDAVQRLRETRQMIFITHNANIPVLGEADTIIVMNSDGKKGYVQKTGSLDECRDEIVDLLEGGRKAFNERSRRYGHS